jgi:PTS system galactitol-specific IIB component
MTSIILACGSGIATSTAVAAKVRDLLDANGYAGEYKITQCAIAEAASKSASADLLIATTVKPSGLKCPYIAGVPFLTGIGRAAAEQQVLDFMKQR